MIKIILTCFALFCQFKALAASTDPLVIEVGDSLKVPSVKEKIWIENQKIVQALSNGNSIQLKGLNIGSSKIRLDKRNQIVIVLPAGQIQSYLDWKKLAYQFADVQVSQCHDVICLTGKLSTFKEFQKIVLLMKENSSYVYLGLKISEPLKAEIEKWYQNYFRENGLLPHKIIFSHPCKSFSNTTDSFNKVKYQMEKIGLYHLEDKQKLEISENLRVEIKVVEIKKSLVRTLGLKWPDSYSASILNLTSAEENNFDLLLTASERTGDMNVLASPNLMCKSGKEATFFAGGEFPIKAIGERFSSVSWKQYGIHLKIKPLIDSIGQINLEIESEISSLDTSHAIDGIPALHSYKVTSHFDLLKSQTIILSGLIKNESGLSSEGLPFLSELPVLGRLFSSKNFLENKTELVIFVTPKLSE
jgi:pilus assembly protein CpaC